MKDERGTHKPGAYIGNEPELAADRVPGGVQPEDKRVAAHSTQPDPVRDASGDENGSASGPADAQRTGDGATRSEP
jgi:hypothetical protein